jgi:hypothetical protein
MDGVERTDGSRGMAMAKRRRRCGKRRKRPSLIVVAVLVLLAAGFVTRRVLAPRAIHFLTHRSATSAEHSAFGQRQPPADGPAEALSDSERRALDQVVRERSK